MASKGKILGGILLVSGTAVGAGMLALPISTANNGFLPSVAAFVLCWFFMVVAALLLLEVNLQLPGENDLISMAGATFGVYGKVFTAVAYLVLLYALLVAYLQGSSAWLAVMMQSFPVNLSVQTLLGIVAIGFGALIFLGVSVAEYVNRYLTFGFIGAYAVLVICALPHVEMPKLMAYQGSELSASFPLIITAFGFSVVLPSLTNYLDRNFKVLRYVVVVGSLIPLFIYLLWELVALGIIPLTGVNSFQGFGQHMDDGMGVAFALQQITGSAWISESSRWFTIFVILTSLLGVSQALFHFLADAFCIKVRSVPQRLCLILSVYVPPVAIALFYPYGFTRILSFGGIFVAILQGILPAIMAWHYRLSKKEHRVVAYQVWGGTPLLVWVILFFSYIIYLKVSHCLLTAQ